MIVAVSTDHSFQPLTMGIEDRGSGQTGSGALRPFLPGTCQTSTALLSSAAAQDSASSGTSLLEGGFPKRPAEEQRLGGGTPAQGIGPAKGQKEARVLQCLRR